MREVRKIIGLIKSKRVDGASVLLNYMSEDWGISLFPNFNPSQNPELDAQHVTEILSHRMGISETDIDVTVNRDNGQWESRTVKTTADPEKAERHGPQALYTFYYATISLLNTPPEMARSDFKLLGDRYLWRTLGELKLSKRTRKHNYDILQHIGSNFDRSLSGIPLSTDIVISAIVESPDYPERPESVRFEHDDALVFLSYAREDEVFAEEVFRRLRSLGVNTWMDTKSILPGQDWKHAVSDAIKECRIFLALTSSDSIDKRGYVQHELRRALDTLENYPPDDVFLIPVRLDDCEPRHQRLGDLQWLDLHPDFELGFAKLVSTLHAIGICPRRKLPK